MNVPLRLVCVVFGVLVCALGWLSLSGCGECQYDADCVDGLCSGGKCQRKNVPPDRRPPPGNCVNGETRECYSGPEGTANKGICKRGKQACIGGNWGTCDGEVLPQKETCDKIDNNCDGTVDDGCSCTDGDTQACYTGNPATRNKGSCRAGNQQCVNGEWGTCLKQVLPQAETCDNQDNDCNGLVDDGVSKKCQNSCGIGEEVCKNGQFLPCDAPTPTGEKCGDGKDNDCDGTIDEGCDCTPNSVRSCYSGTPGTDGEGPCKKGSQVCSVDGKWLDCQGQVTPKVEQCNNRDEDCNGKIDDDLKRPCSRGCNQGQEFCQAGQWKGCNAAPAEPEVCDGKDNDCNGKTDDLPGGQKCQCNVGQKEVCYDGPKPTLGKGPCKAGQRLCESSGKWSLCLQQVLPSVEDCDGKDNDCDGSIDNQPNGSGNLTRPCYDGLQGTAGKGLCKKGTQTCQSQTWSSCQGQVTPTNEVCDGKDNNCDGKIDEKLTRTCYSGAAGTAGKGDCKEGTQTCSGGKWASCSGEITPRAETCNQKDDDCDGATDEDGVCNVCNSGQTQSCYTGPSNTRGRSPCKDGTAQCVSGQWGACIGERTPKTETCNGADDDCDGLTDDGVTRPCTSVCGAGKETCSAGRWGACDAPKPQAEICDGKDNDCDGSVDEGLRCTVLASSSTTGTLSLWDPASYKLLRQFSNSSGVRQIAFSKDGKLLAAATTGGTKIYNATTGALQKTLSTGSALSVAFSPTTQELAVGASNTLQFWRLSNYTRRLSLRATYDASCLAYHPQGSWVVLCNRTTLFFINPSTGKTLSSPSWPFRVYSIDVGPNGKYLLTGGYRQGLFSKSARAELYDASSLPPTKLTSYPVSGSEVYGVDISPDGTLIAAAARDELKIWTRSTGQQKASFQLSGSWNYYSVSFRSNNRQLAFGAHDRSASKNYLYLYDISGSSPLFQNRQSHSGEIRSLLFRD